MAKPATLTEFLAHVILAGTGQVADPVKWDFAPKGEFKHNKDLAAWSETVSDGVAFYHSNEFPDARFSLNLLHPASRSIWEMFWIRVDVTRDGTVYNNHVVIRGSLHECGVVAGCPWPDGIAKYESPREAFQKPIHPQDFLGIDLHAVDPLPVMSGNENAVLQFLQLNALRPEVGQVSLVFNMFKFVEDYIGKEYGLAQDLQSCFEEMRVAVPVVCRENYMTPAERMTYRALTALFLLGPAYSNFFRLRQEVFEKAWAACADVGEAFMDSRNFTDLIWRIGYSCPKEGRSRRQENLLGQLLARNRNGEYDPYVKHGDLLDVDVLTDDPWARALLKQARVAYAFVNCNTFHLAAMAKRFTAETFEKMGPAWKSELEAFSAVASGMEESPFVGLRSPLPKQQTAASWPRLTLIGLHHRASIAGEWEAMCVSEQIHKASSQLRNTLDEHMCKNLASLIPRGPQGKKAMVEGASLAVARRIMKEEPEDARREVLGLLVKAGVKCEWRTYQETLSNRNKRKGD